MANEEHLNLLKQGVDVWNAWRFANPNVQPDLSEADLSLENLQESDLRGAYLCRTHLSKAILFRVNFSEADLTESRLTKADLIGADLHRANLQGVDLQEATIGGTIFTDTDLSTINGLESVQHHGPSSIDILTLVNSRGKIPPDFLRGCGVPQTLIDYLPALIGAMQPIQFYSCFISYSSKDETFSRRLYADLQSRNVPCWFAPEDLKIGERIRVGIDEAIRVHDKLLLVLSKTSVASDWVEKEVEAAMEKERRQKRTVLFPIRLDNAVMEIESGWPADIRRGRNIGDFRRWKNHDAYQKAFARLLRDLQATDAPLQT